MMVSRGGRARMVDISGKTDIIRIARASGVIHLKESTLERVSKGSIEKGDPLAVGEVAATLAAKQTPSLIPLCHPIPITSVNLDFKIETDGIRVTSEVKSLGKTGVEMEEPRSELETPTFEACHRVYSKIRARKRRLRYSCKPNHRQRGS
ncbi:MAG: cyclic pyranopterin monophosphate synthase MoaC [Candidatus Bathyarchaeia archaeon]